MDKNSFGMHLILDCYKCNPQKLNDPVFLRGMLDTVVKEIGMNKISKPLVLRYGGNDKKDGGGCSGFVIVAESHVSFHSFPFNKGFMTIDIYSCKEFDCTKAIHVLARELEAKNWHPVILERGLAFKDYE